MAEKKTTNLILSRTRRNQIYLPYARKKPYFEAIASGDDNRIAELSQENYEYPTALYNRCGSYSEAMNKMYYEAVGAANEMCLIAIQAGLLDMVQAFHFSLRDLAAHILGYVQLEHQPGDETAAPAVFILVAPFGRPRSDKVVRGYGIGVFRKPEDNPAPG